MTWLVESPWTILIVGGLIELAFVVALLRSGRGIFLAPVVGVGLLTAGLLLVERMIVTNREAITTTLDDLATTLATNNVDAVLAYIDPGATEVRQRARQQLPMAHINSARVGGDLAIEVNQNASPPTARATFTGVIQGRLVRTPIPYETYVRRFEVDFVKPTDRWLITGATDSDPNFLRKSEHHK